jgi:hypothetical protein
MISLRLFRTQQTTSGRFQVSDPTFETASQRLQRAVLIFRQAAPLHTSQAGLFNAQFMTRMASTALMPPKAMRCRPSVTLRMSLKRRMLVANERRRAKMPGLQRMLFQRSGRVP